MSAGANCGGGVGRGGALFVGTNKGLFVYTSDAARHRWELEGPYLSGWKISALYAYRARGRLFAATCHMAYGATVRVSEGLGGEWRQLPGSPRYPAGCGREVRRIWRFTHGGPAAPGLLYAGASRITAVIPRDRTNFRAPACGASI